MDERAYKILEAAIEEFIGEGKPVSSKQLAKKYKFGVKDATIRAELNNLTNDGFLSQPHTSGGRMPTDKGYQFLVNYITRDLIDSVNSANKHLENLISVLLRHEWPDFIDEISQEMKLLGVGYQNSTSSVYKSGLDELFGHLELETKNDFYEVARDFEELDERFEKIPKMLDGNSGPQIFIGKQSPITESPHLSVIIDGYNIDGERFYLAAIGPKRMDYQKNLKTFKQIKNAYERNKRK